MTVEEQRPTILMANTYCPLENMRIYCIFFMPKGVCNVSKMRLNINIADQYHFGEYVSTINIVIFDI